MRRETRDGTCGLRLRPWTAAEYGFSVTAGEDHVHTPSFTPSHPPTRGQSRFYDECPEPLPARAEPERAQDATRGRWRPMARNAAATRHRAAQRDEVQWEAAMAASRHLQATLGLDVEPEPTVPSTRRQVTGSPCRRCGRGPLAPGRRCGWCGFREGARGTTQADILPNTESGA